MSAYLPAPRTREAVNRPPVLSLPSPPVSAGMSSGGHALDRHTQSRMSAQFGHDFSSVRIHTDSRAEENAQAMGANAFASGNDITFAPGKYLPGSRDTERLLAHELTHVVQQAKGGPGDPTQVSSRADASEREADALASDVTGGRRVQVQSRPGAALARDTGDHSLASAFEMLGMPKDEHQRQMAELQEHPLAGAFGMLGMPDKAAAEGSSPVLDALTDDRTTGGAAFAQEAETDLPLISKATALGGTSPVNAVLSPLGVWAGQKNLRKAYDEGDWGEGIKSGLGLGSSLIGTAGLVGTGMTALGGAVGSTGLASVGAALSGAVSTGGGAALGVVGGGSTLGVLGAAAGAGLAGYAVGTEGLAGANSHAKSNVLFGRGDDGEARDSTDAAADAGISVKNAITNASIGGHQLPGQKYLGDFVGGTTAVVGSLGTAAYSGLHAASQPTSTEDIAEMIQQAADRNKMDAAMTQTADAQMNAETEKDLDGPNLSVAHEEMPPLPAQNRR